MIGIGRRAVRVVKTDRWLKIDVDSLRRQVRQDRQDGLAPFMVVGSAGTTAAGVIDPLPDIAAVLPRRGLWFHADAAWGGAAILSSRPQAASRRHRTRGLNYLRRAQMALRSHGMRHVLLPSPGERGACFPPT